MDTALIAATTLPGWASAVLSFREWTSCAATGVHVLTDADYHACWVENISLVEAWHMFIVDHHMNGYLPWIVESLALAALHCSCSSPTKELTSAEDCKVVVFMATWVHVSAHGLLLLHPGTRL